MEFKQIQELMKAVNKSNISELSVKQGDFEIVIKQKNSNETQYVAVQAPIQAQLPVSTPPPSATSTTSQSLDSTSQSQNNSAITTDNTVTIKSPMIGTFYRSSSPDNPPFVNVGDEIKPGQVLCIIEAMKLFNEIESEVSGKIVKVLIDDASPVEYDQPLFLVEPA